MLANDMKKFGKILIPVALLAWGLFYLLVSGPSLDIPSWLLWLSVVVGLAVTLAVGAALVFRNRARNKQRW
jgi:hypothetical protein